MVWWTSYVEGIGFVYSMPGTEVKFNHNTPRKFFSSWKGKLGTKIGQHNYGGVVDDVDWMPPRAA